MQELSNDDCKALDPTNAESDDEVEGQKVALKELEITRGSGEKELEVAKPLPVIQGYHHHSH